MLGTLTTETLAPIIETLTASGATPQVTTDDYGNPHIVIGEDNGPVVQRHSLIGGEQVVAIDSDGNLYRYPPTNSDPLGPITNAPEGVTALWDQVVVAFPSAAVV